MLHNKPYKMALYTYESIKICAKTSKYQLIIYK